jgi:hypothetical protein
MMETMVEAAKTSRRCTAKEELQELLSGDIQSLIHEIQVHKIETGNAE